MFDLSVCRDPECPAQWKCYRHKSSGTHPTPLRQAEVDFKRKPNQQFCRSFVPAGFERLILSRPEHTVKEKSDG